MSNDRDVRMSQMEVAKLRKENQTLKVKVRELSCRSSFLQTKVAKLSNQIHEFVTGEFEDPREEDAFIITCAKKLGRKLGQCADDAMYKVKQHHESTDSISQLSYSLLLEELETASPSYGKKLIDFISIMIEESGSIASVKPRCVYNTLACLINASNEGWRHPYSLAYGNYLSIKTGSSAEALNLYGRLIPGGMSDLELSTKRQQFVKQYMDYVSSDEFRIHRNVLVVFDNNGKYKQSITTACQSNPYHVPVWTNRMFITLKKYTFYQNNVEFSPLNWNKVESVQNLNDVFAFGNKKVYETCMQDENFSGFSDLQYLQGETNNLLEELISAKIDYSSTSYEVRNADEMLDDDGVAIPTDENGAPLMKVCTSNRCNARYTNRKRKCSACEAPLMTHKSCKGLKTLSHTKIRTRKDSESNYDGAFFRVLSKSADGSRHESSMLTIKGNDDLLPCKRAMNISLFSFNRVRWRLGGKRRNQRL